jgi:hypothetical protein
VVGSLVASKDARPGLVGRRFGQPGIGVIEPGVAQGDLNLY